MRRPVDLPQQVDVEPRFARLVHEDRDQQQLPIGQSHTQLTTVLPNLYVLHRHATELSHGFGDATQFLDWGGGHSTAGDRLRDVLDEDFLKRVVG